MKRKRVSRVSCSFRLPLLTKRQVRALANHYQCSQTQVLEQAIAELHATTMIEQSIQPGQQEREKEEKEEKEEREVSLI